MTTFSGGFDPAILPDTISAEIFDSSERAATIVGSAMIDDELKRKLLEHLQPCENPKRDPLFNADERPLSSFNAKIHLAQRMGIIRPEFASILHRLRDIRNDYAHVPATNTQSIVDARNSLTTDFFFGSYLFDAGTVTMRDAAITVQGTYCCPPTPLARMLERNATPQEVSFRMMLIAILGHLSQHSHDTKGAVKISIVYTYTTENAERRSITSATLMCDKL